LLFIAAVFGVSLLLKQLTWPAWAWRLPVYAIGSMAAFWTIQRIAGFG
ncbi:MAG: HupE/UreJ family protein, partial [Desulfuromonadales bacterium]|nr:HupE/UreJ family protein [Desulfuromonadales bacterium]